MRRLVLAALVTALVGVSCAPEEPARSAEPPVTYTIVAHGNLFNVYDIHVKAGRHLVLRLVNPDSGDWHGLTVRRLDPDQVVLAPTTVRGVGEDSFDVGQLDAGTYILTCPIARGMNATLTVDEATTG